MLTVLVVDDYPMVALGLAEVLDEAGEAATVGAVGSGAAALARLRQGAWDVLVLDMTLPGEDVVALTRQIAGEWPQLRILLLGAETEDPHTVAAALDAGAAACLGKDSGPQELVAALRALAGATER